MKCLIIATGNSSRLSQKDNSKPLIPVLGVPLIERVIRYAMQAGIEEFYVVSSYSSEQVRSFLDGLAPRCNITITHVINDDPDQETGISVLNAREHLSEPFLLLMAHHLFDP